MRTNIFQVVSQGVVTYIPSTKQEGGQLAKCVIRLREFGRGKYMNEYACTMFGNLALCRFTENDVVAASLRFHVRDVNGNCYQEVVVNEIFDFSSMIRF